ncbi:hypothetical protein [Streptococcus anginosus]|uniref:Uncharacterized protein n=1 Tax=Streptococcus anginosus TaxID=1328 RepID=A0A448AJ33_STRAP|nr:hypothetical protein [Streptococcus anginosus]GAD41311.1 hypothetical protein ANG3_1774 [Streptococcus intermedius SK54 = ATCC 27335]EGL45798.1 hypothetical protein HMPREF9966_0016 [Streptococcus anginosus SK52 = DSM 20563]MBZ2158166.1 hypothetical protein [Streptococcus anginosus]ORE81949.1 hypothetical protein B6C93_07405 [Streptococcus anginosus SK52 = DSM 20563]UEB01520.1 hypothetical protein LK450_06040 [Streptococcus anginosus subsp. anginosus]
MLLKFNQRIKEISLNSICENIQNLTDYAEVVADVQKIMLSTENRFSRMEQSKVYDKCKYVYDVLNSNTYNANDLYFATEFLIQLSEKNDIQTVKEREIFSKTIGILVNICSKILESKIEIRDLCLKCHVQVLAIELILRLNRDVIKSKIYYTQKEVAYLFTHRYLPSLVYEFQQFQGVNNKEISINWIGRKLAEITHLDGEIVSLGRKNYVSINAIKELERRIPRVSDSLDILSPMEETILDIERTLSKKQRGLVDLKADSSFWKSNVEQYFQSSNHLLYKVIFVDFYIQLFIIIQKSSLPLTVDEVITQMEYQFQKETVFREFLKNNESLLRDMSDKVHEFIENISEGNLFENTLDEFSKIQDLRGTHHSILDLNTTRNEINLYKLARDAKVFDSDYYWYHDFLKNTLYTYKNFMDKSAKKHIDNIENNLQFLVQESSKNQQDYIPLEDFFKKRR